MNDAAVRSIAQSDPVPNLTLRWGNLVKMARHNVESLTAALRELDKVEAALAEHDLDVTVDLGPVGNAAAATLRDLERDNSRTFELPR